jgi:ribosomal protein L37AE/L43A
MMIKRIASCLIMIMLVLVFSALPADGFDGNDYGGDDGGWDSDSDDSWDYDDDDSWDSGSDDGWDSGDDGSGSGSGSNDSSFDISDNATVAIGIAVILIPVVIGIANAIFIAKKRRKSGERGGSKNITNRTTIRPSSSEGLHVNLPHRTVEIERIIKGHDPNFSSSDFLSFVKRVYIDIQTAWCKRDLAPVRLLLHDNLFDATVRQIQAKIDQGVVYHYESMVVNTAYLTSYARDKQYEYLTVYLNARMIDWQEDERTGAILRGDKTTRWDLRYKMKFMRSVGILTKEAASGVTDHNCPNCDAPLEMVSSGKCSYCGSVVTTGQYSWVLSDFGTIRNDTVDEGIRID